MKSLWKPWDMKWILDVIHWFCGVLRISSANKFYSNLLRIYSRPELRTRPRRPFIKGWQTTIRLFDLAEAKISAVGGDYALCWCAKGATCSEAREMMGVTAEREEIFVDSQEGKRPQNLQEKNVFFPRRCLGAFVFHQIWNHVMYTSNAVRDLANDYYSFRCRETVVLYTQWMKRPICCS